MTMNRHLFFTCTILTLAFYSYGCNEEDVPVFGPGIFDWQCTLDNGYILSRSSPTSIAIIPRGGHGPNPNGDGNSQPFVPATVVELGWDNNYIIAKCHPRKPHDDKSPDSGTEIIQYWILDIRNKADVFKDVGYGPLTLEEYQLKRKTLSLPEKLQLMTVDKAYQWAKDNNKLL